MIVAGGGTGGHLFPGVAVAEALGEGDAAMFIGSSSGIEARVIPRTRFPFVALEVHGVRGRGLRGIAEFVMQIPVALYCSFREVARFGADVIVGVGGYASFPAVVAGWARGIPTVVLEQNAHPGMANRVMGRIASRVCISFAAAERYFPAGRVEVTGNPVRRFVAGDRIAADGQLRLFVFGGSQGARSINEAMCDAASSLRDSIRGLRIVHQTGRGLAEDARRRYAEAGVDAEVHEFIDDMASAYANADLVVCRSGATTLAELAIVGRAAILIPYPLAADDHQRSNAEVMVEAGAARMILDADLNGGVLAEEIQSLLGSDGLLERMEGAAKKLAEPEAAERVVGLCRTLVASRLEGEG